MSNAALFFFPFICDVHTLCSILWLDTCFFPSNCIHTASFNWYYTNRKNKSERTNEQTPLKMKLFQWLCLCSRSLSIHLIFYFAPPYLLKCKYSRIAFNFLQVARQSRCMSPEIIKTTTNNPTLEFIVKTHASDLFIV